jgi:hypothetical protein
LRGRGTGIERTALEPATDRALVREVLCGKPALKVPLFSRNDHQRHESVRWKQRKEDGEAIDPCSEAEVNEREREIDRISTERVRTRTNDRGRGTVAWDGSARVPKGTHRENEESASHEHNHDAERHADWIREQTDRPDQVNDDAETD